MKKKKLIPLICASIVVTGAAITFMSLFIIQNNGIRNAYYSYKKEHPLYEGSFDEWFHDMKTGNYARINSYETFYNIIYANATIPPVISALECLKNGYKTYALIERGKTYAGIAETDFVNLGFDVTQMYGRRFTQTEFTNVVNQIKTLNQFGHEHFNIYTVDYRGLDGAAIASNANLTDKQYHVYMVEDGTATYGGLYNCYIKNKKVDVTLDEPYNEFKSQLANTKNDLKTVFSNKNNTITDSIFNDSQRRIWTLSTLDNFSLIIQDKEALKTVFKRTDNLSKMASVFSLDTQSVDEKANLKVKSISDGVNELNAEQKKTYIKLMYGKYYEKTYNTLKRTTLSDGVTAVPSKKMIFIPGRIMTFAKVASDSFNGIGGIPQTEELPASYSALDDKYKNKLLFDKEEDYTSFLKIFDNQTLWKNNPTDAQKVATKRELFNHLIDYMFILKYAWQTYGDKYDIIMKGHPSEEIDIPASWSNHYVTTTDGAGGGYNYDYLMSAAAIDFHNNNSVGKYIGMVPYGTAAENLAYLGVEIGLGGLRSSTYTGYDTSVPVEFVLDLVDGDITSDNNLAARYNAGNLFYYDKDGNKKTSKFINKGKFYETMRDYFGSTTELGIKYNDLRTDWLKQKTGLEDVSGYTIDDQGFVHSPAFSSRP